MIYRRNAKEILDNSSNYGGEVVGAGKGKFAGGTEIPQELELISSVVVPSSRLNGRPT